MRLFLCYTFRGVRVGTGGAWGRGARGDGVPVYVT